MPHQTLFIFILAPLFLIVASCKSAHKRTLSPIDQKTSFAFIKAAQMLLRQTQSRQTKVGIISSSSDSSIVTTSQDISKKKSLLKSLRFKKQKIKKATSSNMLNILAKSDTYASEHIIGTYMEALSLYTYAYKSQTPSMRIYLKTQISNVIKVVRNLLAPTRLDADTTLLETEYQDILKKATDILRDPYTLRSALSDIKERVQHLKKHPNENTLFMLLHSLHSLKKKSNPYQSAIIRLYAHEIIKIIDDIKNRASSSENENILNYWRSSKSTQLDFDKLIKSLQKRFEHSSKLCNTSSAQTKEPFRLKLLEEQISMLKKLLSIHKDYDDIFNRYWIAQEAQKIEQLVKERLLNNKEHTQWKKICGKWYGESDDLSTILNYIMQCVDIVLPREDFIKSSSNKHIMVSCFNALPILIDIYQRYVLPPPLLQKITVPMRTILDFLLLLTNKCDLKLSDNQEKIKQKARLMTSTSTRVYAANYHCKLGAQHMKHKNLQKAKEHYILARKSLLDARKLSANPILLNAMCSHIYISLVQLLEQKIPFSWDDLAITVNLAEEVGIVPTHPQLVSMPKANPIKALNTETKKLTSFLEKLSKAGLLEKKQQNTSSSSSNQK